MRRDCVFCQRANRGEFDDSYNGAAEDVVWFEPLNPVTPGHMLFLTRRHAEHPDRQAVAVAMFAAVRYAMVRPEDYNLITSSGAAATQTIDHIHVHYVPRRKGDGLSLPWTGQVTS
jgi:histidine triad (HIT) family protein